MTRKPMYKKVLEKWTNKKGESHERTFPKRHSKKYLEHKENNLRDERWKMNQTKITRIIKCECGAEYTDEEFLKLEMTGHNIIWNFDYRRCECGEEIYAL